MVKLVFVRTAGALGVMSLALLIVGIVPFLSADPTAGAGLFKAPYTVNHEFKGDRLPLTAVDSSVSRGTASRLRARTPEEIPVGCDPAFSPVSSPRMAYFYGRCMT